MDEIDYQILKFFKESNGFKELKENTCPAYLINAGLMFYGEKENRCDHRLDMLCRIGWLEQRINGAFVYQEFKIINQGEIAFNSEAMKRRDIASKEESERNLISLNTIKAEKDIKPKYLSKDWIIEKILENLIGLLVGGLLGFLLGKNL